MLTSLAALVLCISASAQADTIGLKLASDNNGASGTSTLAPTDVAGVVPIDHWNNAPGSSGSLSNLTNSTGAVTSYTASWTANQTFAATNEDNTDQFSGADHTLMNGYLDVFSGQTATVTIGNLPIGRAYDVYVYGLPSVVGRGGSFNINGGTGQTDVAAVSTSYVPNVNYSLFAHEVVPNTGTITLNVPGDSFRTSVQGIELVQYTPEPSTFILGGLGALGLLLAARRRRG